nr:hypothetical protein Iba_chr05aCG14210 [Ipomoea batatas]GMC94159.1 hypothetical protein Iba_chr05bCG9180 [Ipomoea batatas]GMC98238.1 hypothetical protein Iba_chr05dCG14680 [Ipomoea batatas]
MHLKFFATTFGQTPEPNQLCTTVRGLSLDAKVLKRTYQLTGVQFCDIAIS